MTDEFFKKCTNLQQPYCFIKIHWRVKGFWIWKKHYYLRLKSNKDGRVLPIFQLELSDPAEAEALLSQNLMCNVTGIVYKVEEFRQPVSVRQCFNCQCFGH